MKELMILGGFHFEGTYDAKQTEGKDKLEEMQGEIDELIEKMAKFKPTKVFVEVEKTRQNELDQWWGMYQEGKLKSQKNEVFKVAFPIAEKCGSKLLAIDWMEQGAATIPCGEAMAELEKYTDLKKEIEQYEIPVSNISDGIIKNFKHLNAKEVSDNQKAYYVNYARIGVDKYYGMGWLIWWYQRNLNIFANMSDKIEDGDRAMLLIGAAHKGILEEFFEDSKTVKLVDPLQYL